MDQKTSPNLRSGEPTLSNRGNQATYEVYSKRFPVIEQSLLLKIFRVSLDLNITFTVVDSTTDSSFNQFRVISTLVIEYEGVTYLSLHNLTDYFSNDYTIKNDFDATIGLSLPMEFPNTNISPGLSLKLLLYVRTSHSMRKIGKQLSFSRNIRVWSNCEAYRYVDTGDARA